MKTETVHTIYFSPTGTSRKIAEAVAEGLTAAGSRRAIPVDLTHPIGGPTVLSEAGAAVIAVPVYGGKVAPTARKRLETVHAEGMPAVLIVLYGNRAFEGALAELAELATAQGFLPFAAAAFVGEHSYSSERYPIAAGRPDADDLAEASAFGRRTAERLAKAERAGAMGGPNTDGMGEAAHTEPEETVRTAQAGDTEQRETVGAADTDTEPNEAERAAQAAHTEPKETERTAQAAQAGDSEQRETMRAADTDTEPNEAERAAQAAHTEPKGPVVSAAKSAIEPIDVRKIVHPASGFWPMLRFVRFVFGYRRRQKRHPVVYLPATDPAACVHCGICAARCPVKAIAKGDEEHTDPARCIRCCACVKGCPVSARTFDTPFAAALARNFRKRKPNVFLPAERSSR